MHSAFSDPTRVSPTVAPLLDAMLNDPRPAYAHAALSAAQSLEAGTLVGIQTNTERFWIRSRVRDAQPIAAPSGAHVQCHYLRSPPRTANDVLAWVIVQDGYAGGAMVMAHELCHMTNRFNVWRLAQSGGDLVDASLGEGFSDEQIGWVKATFVNEVAARHVAYLGESGARPGQHPMPSTGSLVGCATTISRYPVIYNDCGVMQRLLDRHDEPLLRDQVGRWFQSVIDLDFFSPGSDFAKAHHAFLEAECAHASLGRHAPVVFGDGTL